MFVCNCNALNQRNIKDAVDAGAKCWREVHGHHGCTPQCGACEDEITEEVDKHNTSAANALPIANDNAPASRISENL